MKASSKKGRMACNNKYKRALWIVMILYRLLIHTE
nr:MAG TPA: hypothetical protein [Caudoviricetes sp.]